MLDEDYIENSRPEVSLKIELEITGGQIWKFWGISGQIWKISKSCLGRFGNHLKIFQAWSIDIDRQIPRHVMTRMVLEDS